MAHAANDAVRQAVQPSSSAANSWAENQRISAIFWNLEKNYPASWAAKSAFLKIMFFFVFISGICEKKRPASWVEKISIFESSNLEFLELTKKSPS